MQGKVLFPRRPLGKEGRLHLHKSFLYLPAQKRIKVRRRRGWSWPPGQSAFFSWTSIGMGWGGPLANSTGLARSQKPRRQCFGPDSPFKLTACLLLRISLPPPASLSPQRDPTGRMPKEPGPLHFLWACNNGMLGLAPRPQLAKIACGDHRAQAAALLHLWRRHRPRVHSFSSEGG